MSVACDLDSPPFPSPQRAPRAPAEGSRRLPLGVPARQRLRGASGASLSRASRGTLGLRASSHPATPGDRGPTPAPRLPRLPVPGGWTGAPTSPPGGLAPPLPLERRPRPHRACSVRPPGGPRSPPARGSAFRRAGTTRPAPRPGPASAPPTAQGPAPPTVPVPVPPRPARRSRPRPPSRSGTRSPDSAARWELPSGEPCR